MKILIVGMGLIGGSVCKALKNKTQYEVYGCDVDESVLQQALQDHAIDGTGKMEDGIYDVCMIVVSSVGTQQSIKKALSAGVKDFVQKPIDKTQLMRIVDAFLDGRN